jgi:hypothetical protein
MGRSELSFEGQSSARFAKGASVRMACRRICARLTTWDGPARRWQQTGAEQGRLMDDRHALI